jgi:hypothetical protein
MHRTSTRRAGELVAASRGTLRIEHDDEMAPRAIALDISLDLAPGTDPRAPGGEVTVALCGHWEHDGPCRWPHNSRIDGTPDDVRLRTIVAVSDAEREEVLELIAVALDRDDRWDVVGFEVDDVSDDERALADRLLTVAE